MTAERGRPPSVALLHGADPQLLDDALAAVTRGLFGDAAQALLDREVLDAREADAETIVRSAEMLPLQAGARLIAVRHCQALAARGAEVLGPYVANPNPRTHLLLLAEESLRGARERKDHWLLGVLPSAAVIELQARRGRALEDWLRQRAEAEKLTISAEAVRLLVQWVGEDTATLLGEIRKAALAGGPDNRTIGVNEVTAVVGEHRLSGVFDLTRAIERREVAQALRTLDRLLVSEEPLFLLSMLTRELRTAWTARAWLERGQTVEEIARMLRRPPHAVEALAATRTIPYKLRRCWEVELALKSGGAAEAEMVALIAELCDAA